jgi:hypothetical protein
VKSIIRRKLPAKYFRLFQGSCAAPSCQNMQRVRTAVCSDRPPVIRCRLPLALALGSLCTSLSNASVPLSPYHLRTKICGEAVDRAFTLLSPRLCVQTFPHANRAQCANKHLNDNDVPKIANRWSRFS